MLGCGLPLRTLFFSAPLGPANKFGACPRCFPPSSSACSCFASSSSRRSCSCTASDELDPFVLGTLCAIAFFTRMISPSRNPSERIVDSVISAKIVSSILSLSKDEAYREQSSTSHPALRKNSNQSVVGVFLADDVRGGALAAPMLAPRIASGCNDRRRSSSGSSSSEDLRGELAFLLMIFST